MNKETVELHQRIKEANIIAENGEAKALFSGHDCEICYTRGCGVDDLNLICDPCQKALPALLRAGKDIEPLRELFQEYQDAKEAQETEQWNRKWLNKFIPLIDKLLE